MQTPIRRSIVALMLLAGNAHAAAPTAAAPHAAEKPAVAPSAPAAPSSHGSAATAKAPATSPATATEWRQLALSEGRRLEVDPKSVKKEGEQIVVSTRTVFDKAMPDAISGSTYRIIESTSRYDCTKRTAANLKRVYRKEQDESIREEANKSPVDLPVRSGTFDDKILKTACSPTGFAHLSEPAGKTGTTADAKRREILKADLAVTDEHRKAPPAPAARRPATPHKPAAAHAGAGVAHAAAHPQWSYEGPGGPAEWARLAPENQICGTGQRQSPIDIRDSIAVDLEPIDFRYRPTGFRVVDNGHTIQVELDNNEISLLGNNYRLLQFHFHRPSEERINGRSFEMVVHLVHRGDDGKLAVVAVPLEKGKENPAIQTVWNHLPLEKGQTTAPPAAEIDPTRLLPVQRDYYTFMGSLTTPPCTEGVLWLVLKTPVELSPEQAGIFARLYRHNARPIQPDNGRLIKGSR